MREKNEEHEINLSVANRVLMAFVDALAQEQELIEVAARLKPMLLANITVNEVKLREAIFNDTDT